jgi:AcrR family transcriptional regulator
VTSTGVRPEASRRSPAERFDERRDALAESALTTLGQLGYARTSLREIAHNSPFSHGVVHYYFRDKIDLITYCVRYYKARCVQRYDELVETSAGADEIRDRFAAKLAETLVDEAPMHRLWYDLRSQSMFEPALRADVAAIDEALCTMVWRVVERYAALAGRVPAVDPPTAYGLLDGLFEQALHGQLREGAVAVERLVARVRQLLPFLLAPGD